MANDVVTNFIANTASFEADVRRASATLKAEGGRMFDALKQVSSGTSGLEDASKKLVAAQMQASAEFADARAAYKAGTIGLEEFRQKNLETKTALSLIRSEYSRYVNELKQGAAGIQGGVAASNQMRFGLVVLGEQFRQVGTEVALGVDPMRIFAQQSGQVIQSFQMMANEGSAFGRFMGNPWVLAITTAAAAGAPLIAMLLKSGDATQTEIDKLKEDAKQTDEARKAKAEFATTEEGVTKAIRDQQEALDKNIEGLKSEAQQAYEAAKANLQHEISIRNVTKAQIDASIAQNKAYEGSLASADPRFASQFKVSDSAISGLQQQLAEENAAITTAQQNLANAQSLFSVQEGKRLADPLEVIKDKYEGPDGLIEQARKHAVAEGKVGDELQRQVTLLKQQETAAFKAAQESERSSNTSTRNALETASFMRPVSGRITGGFDERRPGHLHAGVDIAVPVGTPVKADAAGVVIEAGTLPGYGNVIFIDHGGGTISRLAHLSQIDVAKGAQVAQGQVIGLSGGAKGAAGAGDSTGPHVHYEVRVNGRPVNPLTGSFPVDSLGAASKAQAATQKAVEEAQRQAEEQARQQKEFADLSAGLDTQLIQAKRANVTDATQIAQFARDQVNAEADKLKADIETKAVTNPLIKAHEDQLEAIVEQTRQQRLLTIDTQEMKRKADEALKDIIAANDNQRDILSAQQDLAQTAEQRRQIQLKLLDLDRKEEEAKLRETIATSQDPNEVARAQQRLNDLPAIYGSRQASVLQSTQSPLEKYISDNNPALIGERVQGLVVDELESVRQGIDNAIMSAIGVKDPLLAGIIDMFIQEVIIQPIARAFQSSMGSGGGLFGSLLGSVGSIFGGGGTSAALTAGMASNDAAYDAIVSTFTFADGGHVTGPGTGTSDSILARLSNGEFVMKADAVQRIGVPTLDRLNRGDHPRFATGGLVGQMPALPAGNDNRAVVPLQIHFHGVPNDKQARESGAQAARAFRAEYARQARIGG